MHSSNGVVGSQDETGDFINIWLLLRRNLKAIAILVVVTVALTAIYMSSIPDRYQTKAQMVLAVSETRFSEATGRMETFEFGRASVETELAKLRSRDFAEQVAEQLSLFDNSSFVNNISKSTGLPIPKEIHREAVIDKVLSSYSVSRAGESHAVTVEGRSTDPVLAASLANTVISVYIENELSGRVARLEKFISDLKRRVGLLGEELTQAEAELAEFIRNDSLDDDQVMVRLRSNVEREKAILSAGIEQGISVEEEQILRARVAEAEEKLQVRTRSELSLLRKEREIELLRSRFQTAIDNLNLLETRIGQVEEGTVQVSVARVPISPYAPNRVLASLLAGMMSIILGFIVALVREGLDRTIRNEQQILKATGLRNLGYFTKQISSDANSEHVIEDLLNNPRSPLAEAARGVLTNCIKFQDAKIILITSGLPNEGKSLVSSVLAASAAADGMDTLLIDLDTHRRGSTKLLFSNPDDVQRSDIYGDNLIVQPVPIAAQAAGTLDLITVESPTRELTDAADNKLRKLRDALTARYDLIVIDTPPALILDEVYRNDALVDAVLLVARWGKTRQDAFGTVARRLSLAGFNVLGTILNDVDPKKFRWIGYDGYYGSYDDY
ncbi:Wzz/FepE/Etk N-terminal domain-containing protein [Roseibium sp. RKSG952]|uniref:GumC family protein n=1 Tax=Roseibium sp. RKSG952 TaxID=2529384 RepID=UPI0012BCEAC9